VGDWSNEGVGFVESLEYQNIDIDKMIMPFDENKAK
jgi:hypothetical protein